MTISLMMLSIIIEGASSHQRETINMTVANWNQYLLVSQMELPTTILLMINDIYCLVIINDHVVISNVGNHRLLTLWLLVNLIRINICWWFKRNYWWLYCGNNWHSSAIYYDNIINDVIEITDGASEAINVPQYFFSFFISRWFS